MCSQILQSDPDFPSSYNTWNAEDTIDIEQRKTSESLMLSRDELKFKTAYIFQLTVSHSALRGQSAKVCMS